MAGDVTQFGGRQDRDGERSHVRLDGMDYEHTVAASSPDCLMLLDRDANIRFINRSVPGLTAAKVLNTPIYRHVPEDARAAIRRCFDKVLETRQPSRYETTCACRNGERSFWEARVGPVIRDGEVVGFAVNSSDVTRRRQAAGDRDRFFDLSFDMLCVLDPVGRFKRINPAVETTLGYAANELLSRPLVAWVHAEDRAGVRRALQKLASGTRVVDFESRQLRQDGEYRWLSWRAVVESGCGLTYAVARDVTEHKSLEEQLRHSQKMDAVGRLAGGVAHDFNNLILAIEGHAALGAERLDDPAQAREHLAEVKRAARRAAALTRQLLAFSRRQTLQFEPVDLSEVTGQLMKLLRRLIPENVEIVVVPGADPARVTADPGQVEQVIVNLCINARDAMPRGGRITIETDHVTIDEEYCRTCSSATPGRYVVLRIADTGCGIAPEVRERVFEPFFTTKAQGQGSGLGLAMVYGIVQQHRGFIELETEQGRGSVFHAFFPATDRPTGEAPAAEVPQRVGGPETVLVAEDEELVRSIVVRILEHAGYDVLASKDGADALEVFRKHEEKIALVLLDMVLPKQSGPEVYLQMRELNPDLTVLFTSGYADPGPIPGADVDPTSVVRKPYTPETLLRRVRQALDER